MHRLHIYLFIVACVASLATTPVSAVMVDNFESYSTGSFPSPDWIYPAGDGTSLTSPPGQTIDVQSNANNISGQHLQFATTFQADTVTRSLPITLSNDGDYIQVAVNIVSGRTLASMFLTSGLYAGGPGSIAPTPPAAVGISTEPGAESFTTQHNGVFDAGLRVSGATPSLDTWYYLRATMRDNSGAASVIDSYDFEIFDDTLNLIASKLGIAFVGGEGPINGVALRSYEQSGTGNAVVLFDEVSVVLVPEPSSVLLAALGGFLFLGLGRHRKNSA